MSTKHSSSVLSMVDNLVSNNNEKASSFGLTQILLIIAIFLNALGIYLLTGNSFSLPIISSVSYGIKQTFLELEYEKVGGKENYDIITLAQQLSLKDPQNQGNLENMKQYVNSFGSGGIAMNQAQQPPSQDGSPLTLDSAKMEKLLQSASIQGNKNADIMVIEYSDTECPFCVKQYQETRIWPRLQEQYGDKVKFAFKNNRGVNHPGTEAKAIGALCAKKVGGDEAYIKFYTTVMDGSTQSLGVYDVAKLPDAAKNSGVNLKQWQDCFDKKDTQGEFAAETSEAQGLGLGGTPGTLILNVKTGKYLTVEGAYPFESFTQKIDSLMN